MSGKWIAQYFRQIAMIQGTLGRGVARDEPSVCPSVDPPEGLAVRQYASDLTSW